MGIHHVMKALLWVAAVLVLENAVSLPSSRNDSRSDKTRILPESLVESEQLLTTGSCSSDFLVAGMCEPFLAANCPIGGFINCTMDFTTFEAVAKCARCEAGTKDVRSTGTVCDYCEICPVNTYSAEGSTSCTNCPAGATTNGLVGQSACVCPSGTTWSSGQCITDKITCASGKYLSGSVCLSCDKCLGVKQVLTACTSTSNTVCQYKGILNTFEDPGSFHDNSALKSTQVTYFDNSGLIDTSSMSFDNPVIFVGPPTFYGNNPVVSRALYDATTKKYKVWLAEPKCFDIWHTNEFTSYVVLETGSYPDFVVGTISMSGADSYQTVTWQDDLGNRPFVFQFVQSNNNGGSTSGTPTGIRGFIKTRMTLAGTTKNSAKILVQADEGTQASAIASETIGYLAVNSGCSSTPSSDSDNVCSCPMDRKACVTRTGTLSLGGKTYYFEIGLIWTSSSASTVTFKNTFTATPVILANTQTVRGGDPSELRISSPSSRGFNVVIDEDTCFDSERTHTDEWVAFMAIGFQKTCASDEYMSGGNCYKCSVCSGVNTLAACSATTNAVCDGKGAMGTFSDPGTFHDNSALNFVSQVSYKDTSSKGLIQLSSTFTSPVIFVGPPTFYGGDPIVSRALYSASTNSYRVWFAEPKCNDIWHTNEFVSYAVFEKGVYTDFVVDTVSISGSESWKTISWTKDLGNRPFVFQFVQSNNNGGDYSGSPTGLRGFVKTRMTLADTTKNSARILLQSDESTSASTVVAETVGFLAVNSGCSSTPSSDSDSLCGCAMDRSTCITRTGSFGIGGSIYRYEIGLTWTSSTAAAISFNTAFTSTPVILANMQTHRGGDPSELRIQSPSRTGFNVFVDEDSCQDSERGHTDEWIAFIAIGQ